MYADDVQIYGSFGDNEFQHIQIKIQLCLNEIKQWMTQNFLQLNTDKTQIQVFWSNFVECRPEVDHFARNTVLHGGHEGGPGRNVALCEGREGGQSTKRRPVRKGPGHELPLRAV